MAEMKLQTNLPVRNINTNGMVSVPLGQASAQTLMAGRLASTPVAQPTRVPVDASVAPVGVSIPFRVE